MISIIEDNCAERKKWITHEDMMNITVIAESTPGPIAINCATFVGKKRGGFWGALAATFGVVLPSFIIICLISMFLDNFLEIELVAHAFSGIKVGVGLLIISAAVNMIRKMKKETFPIIVLVCSFCAMMAIDIFSLNFSSIALMLIAAVISLVVFSLRRKGGDEK